MNIRKIAILSLALPGLLVATSAQPSAATIASGSLLQLSLGPNISVTSVVDGAGYSHSPACDVETSSPTLCVGQLSAAAMNVTVTISAPSGSTITWGGAMAGCTGQTCTILAPGESVISGSVTAVVPTSAPAPTPAPAPTTTTSPASVRSASPAASLPAPAPKALAIPSMSEVKINNTIATGTALTYKSGEAIVLSGKTSPGAKVHLYIYSNPREAEVTADADGVWTYTIKNLESGEHRVEAVITSVEGAVSEKTKLMNFAVLAPVKASNTTTAENSTSQQNSNPYLPYIAAVVGLLAVGSIVAVLWLKKRRAKLRASSNQAKYPTSNDVHF